MSEGFEYSQGDTAAETTYELVLGVGSSGELNARVNELLRSGWELYGPPLITHGADWVVGQALIRTPRAANSFR